MQFSAFFVILNKMRMDKSRSLFRVFKERYVHLQTNTINFKVIRKVLGYT